MYGRFDRLRQLRTGYHREKKQPLGLLVRLLRLLHERLESGNCVDGFLHGFLRSFDAAHCRLHGPLGRGFFIGCFLSWIFRLFCFFLGLFNGGLSGR
jgi:hypothetical protein